MIRTQYDPDLPLVPLDVDLFKQALWNLIRNAQHAMPDGGELILQTRRDGDQAILDVTDTGVGMDEQVAARSSTPSSRPAPAAPGWASPPPARSSRPTAARSPSRANPGKGRCSPSDCRLREGEP